jgi:hypothetical protein
MPAGSAIRQEAQAVSDPPDAVIIVGMHRSGTSLLANTIHELGFYVEDTTESDRFNAAGYWENQEVADLNDSILDALGGEGPFLPPIPEGWERDGRFRGFSDHARRILDRFSLHRRWACKNPNFCVTLPLWKPLLRQKTAYILCVRDPVSVATSLRERDLIPRSIGVRFWERYNTYALVNTAGLRRLVINYDDMIERFESQSRALARFLGVEPHEQVASPASSKLRHHSLRGHWILSAPWASARANALFSRILLAKDNQALLDELTREKEHELLSIKPSQRTVRELETRFLLGLYRTAKFLRNRGEPRNAPL